MLARNKRLAPPSPSSSSSFVLLSPFLSRPSRQIRGWVRVIITSAESTDDSTIERILVLELFTPFGGAVLAHRVGLIISFSAELRNRDEVENKGGGEGQKSGGGMEDPRGRFLELFQRRLNASLFQPRRGPLQVVYSFCLHPLLIAIPRSRCDPGITHFTLAAIKLEIVSVLITENYTNYRINRNSHILRSDLNSLKKKRILSDFLSFAHN